MISFGGSSSGDLFTHTKKKKLTFIKKKYLKRILKEKKIRENRKLVDLNKRNKERKKE